MTQNDNSPKSPHPAQPPREINPSYPVTWEELRNMYADGLSLDKYDEIILRKTCSRLASTPTPDDLGKFINDRCNCKNTECIDYMKELCSPWKCTHYLQRRDTAIRNQTILVWGSQICAYLHYSHTENKRMAVESKGVARHILKGRMFEDTMILEALDELRVTGKITIPSTTTQEHP